MHRKDGTIASYAVRRPLVGLSLAAALGMAIAAVSCIPPGVLFIAAFCSIVFAALLLKSGAADFLLFGCVVLVSACRYAVSVSHLSAADINRLGPELPMEDVELIGRVREPPFYRAYRPGQAGTWVVRMRCEGLNADGQWRRYRGCVRIRISGLETEPVWLQGHRLLVAGTLRSRHMPGGDPVELAVHVSDSCRMPAPLPGHAPIILGQRLRESAARTLETGIKERHLAGNRSREAARLGVYQALLLGYRKAVPPDIHEQFRCTGTLHIFAISGLHVGIMGFLITMMLRMLGIPQDRWGLLLLPLLTVYVVVTGMKSSALRALTMAGVYVFAPLFRRKPDIPSSIAFAALILLFCKPAEILSVGFLYSFTVVSFMVMFFSRVPKGFICGGGGGLRTVRNYVASLCITSVAAFTASMPLTALFFGTLSPVSLLANLVVVPLTFCIVLSGWLSIAVPAAASIFNHAALVFLDLLLGMVDLFARLPGACSRITPPPPAALLFWYWGWIHYLVRARNRALPLILIILAVILAILVS